MRILAAAALLLLPWPARAQPPAVDWERVAQWAGLPEASTAAPAPPEAVKGRPVLALKGFLSVWRQDCAPDCGLPVPILANEPVELSLVLPENPGEFGRARLVRSFPVPGGALEVKADFYALCPPGAAGPACPSRYFSVQVELSGAAASLCTASLNEADFLPFPVLACGGGKSRRLGVSLHRAALP